MKKKQEEAIEDFKREFEQCSYTKSDLIIELDCAKEILNVLKEKDKEIEKKDKIIYKMIDSFIDLGFGFEYCSNDDRCINDCDKCIKQYFERKAKE